MWLNWSFKCSYVAKKIMVFKIEKFEKSGSSFHQLGKLIDYYNDECSTG